MHKGQKCIQTLWDNQKKISFTENYKDCAICAILREKPHFGACTETKTGVARGQVRSKGSPEAPKKCKSLGVIRKKCSLCRQSVILPVRWKFHV